MWANAQCDGRPAEYRWRPLFNAANFGWRPLLECRTVTMPRCESRWNWKGCPKLAKQISAVSSPKFTILRGHVEEVSVFNKFFFRLSTHASAAKIRADKVVRWCQNGDFLHPVFSASSMQHISDMHSKFTLRPHHVWKYSRHPMSDCRD